jgi:serine/threonine protein kinase
MGLRTVYSQYRIQQKQQSEVVQLTFHPRKSSLNQAGRRENSGTSQQEQKVRSQLSSMQFLHTQRAIHCDIKPDNLLLSEDLDLKVCDFAGSSLYGSEAIVCGSRRSWLPTLPRTPRDAQDDIFGLGSTIHDINRKRVFCGIGEC